MAKRTAVKKEYTSNDPLGEFYNRHHLTENSRKGYYSEKNDFFTTELSKKTNSQKGKIKILDIACNDGKLTQYYQKFGDVFGIDINKQAIDQCMARGVQCRLADLADITEEFKNHFDVVIAGDIIEHIFDTDKFLNDIKTVLKPNGIILLTTPNLTSFGRRILFLLGKNPYIEYSPNLPSKEFNVGHIRYYTIANMHLQMDATGFKNISIFGDRINLSKTIAIPYQVAKHFPTISRNMMVYAEKSK